jgi:CRISPR-associated endonuclease/helicase Cas3
MDVIEFGNAFRSLTGNDPFPWQRALYDHFAIGDFPASCNLPTGLGKTNVIAVWLVALLNKPMNIPRRLVYVVNRRTVVDQTTTEVENIRANLQKLTSISAPLRTLAISTLRGQFADNREWSADPSRPAVICGTVDMIGSRLLFSGYGVGFKGKPLHAGFLGQDVLLVHDEAHLEPAFQKLIMGIETEQAVGERTGNLPWPKLRVMELTATPRGGTDVFELTEAEKMPPAKMPEESSSPLRTVWSRLQAKKGIAFHTPDGEKVKIAAKIGELAKERGQASPNSSILVFVNSLENHAVVCNSLKGEKYQVLTGTMRGLERDQMADPRKETGCRIFARFLKPPKPDANETERWKITPMDGTVFLVCTSAGEVGIDISADHMICDLTTYERMAQRMGRVNRYGSGDAMIDVVHEANPDKKKETDPREQARWRTLELLRELPLLANRYSASPLALMRLRGREDLKSKFDLAYTPPPTILPVTDILFDAWALTTIRDKLPGRPPVEPYLHGISDWEPPETHVAWRKEVGIIAGARLEEYPPKDLLELYPLKPHELLRDRSDRVFKHVVDLAGRRPTDPVWLVDDDGNVEVLKLEGLADTNRKERINYKTILLAPDSGGLENGLLNGGSMTADDVADLWFLDVDRKERRRIRLWEDDEEPADFEKKFRLIQEIIIKDDEDEEAEPTIWRWYVRPTSADDDGSKSAKTPITWQHHTNDVEDGAEKLADALLKDQPNLHKALVLAARFHDLGKKRIAWQRSIGNPTPDNWHAKSGKDPITGKMWRPLELTPYRHEFGSLIDLENEEEFKQLGSEDQKELIRHLIAVHHGYGRPHFPRELAFDPERPQTAADQVAIDVPSRFGRLQRKYGRWGLAYLESLLRAADWAASAEPSKEMEP